MAEKNIRILITKLGLDGHDRGAKLVARSLQEAGMNVIYQGIRHTLDQAIDAAVDEQVDYMGLSFLAGDHLTVVPKVIQGLREKDAGKIRIIVGGIIPGNHVPKLKEMGVARVFLPGTPMADIAEFIQQDAAGN